eukprot:4490477-Prymnesium_polylepis.1
MHRRYVFRQRAPSEFRRVVTAHVGGVSMPDSMGKSAGETIGVGSDTVRRSCPTEASDFRSL